MTTCMALREPIAMTERVDTLAASVASAHAVALEEREHATPAVLGRVLAVARPVVGVEPVRRALVDEELHLLRLAGGSRRGLHLVDGRDGDPLVRAPVEAKHRGLELVHAIDRVARTVRRRLANQASVPRDARFQPRVVLGVEPDDASAPAETGDA